MQWPSMDAEKLLSMARLLVNLKMYPYFDAANYVVMCIMVRDDYVPKGSTAFSRKHPLSSWVASMMMCFAGSILSSALVGEPLVAPLKKHNDLLLASAVWYVINYSPFDAAYKLAQFAPVHLVVHSMKQIQTVSKVHHGVAYALKHHPGAYALACVVGVTKGAGYYYMRLFERLVRGVWTPTAHDILYPSFGVKACLVASLVFVLESTGHITSAHVAVYSGVVLFFLYFNAASTLIGVHDPFAPLEGVVCAVFFGGLVDWTSGRRAGRKQGGDGAGQEAGEGAAGAAGAEGSKAKAD